MGTCRPCGGCSSLGAINTHSLSRARPGHVEATAKRVRTSVPKVLGGERKDCRSHNMADGP